MTEPAKHTPGPWSIDCFEGIKIEDNVDFGTIATLGFLTRPHQGPRRSAEEVRANARLIAAAPDLLQCQTMGATLDTPAFLEWLAERLVSRYGEDPGTDFVVSLKERAAAGRAAIAKARGEG